MIGWRAWTENAVYDSREVAWEELPDGLQAVKVWFEEQYLPGKHYNKTLDGKDWYYLSPDGRIEGTSSIGWDGWVAPPCNIPNRNLKRGTAISDAEFECLSKKVAESQWL